MFHLPPHEHQNPGLAPPPLLWELLQRMLVQEQVCFAGCPLTFQFSQLNIGNTHLQLPQPECPETIASISVSPGEGVTFVRLRATPLLN